MLRTSLIVLSLIGLLDSIYLSWIKLSNQEAICSGVGSCDVVNGSEYASIGGVPIALLGAGAYLLMLLILLFERRSKFVEENGLLIVFGLSVAGVIYSAFLTYVELFVIFAICPYCVLSAIVLLLMLILSWMRLRKSWIDL